MKHSYIPILILLLSIIYLFPSCSAKLAEPLKKIQATQYATHWKKLENYPIPHGRSDDLHFFDKNTGFVINSGGYLSYTEDGGETWEVVHENKGTFFRCITFKNRQEGWLGTIGTDDPYLESKDSISLYETKDGGINWSPVQFIGPQPKGLCGLQKVNDDFIVGCGRVRGPSYFIKTTNGGENWHSYNLDHIAGSLIAAHFFDENHGFLIGGTTRGKVECQSMVLETIDGGMNWDTLYISEQKGEYPWKFSFPSKDKGFISIQRNVKSGRFYHLQTEDGGKTWKEFEHSEDYYYVQGIGFIDEKIGWMGGTRNQTYETRDGGKTWAKLRNIGSGFNNFQFLDDSLAYGAGFGVFKCGNIHKDGNELKEEFYSDGSLRSKIEMKHGKKHGVAQFFHPNGQISSSGSLKENLKKGIWTYFDKEGNKVNSVRMRNGIAKIPKENIQSFIGTYRTYDAAIRKIFLEDGQLYSQKDGGSKLAIFPETDNRFYYAFNTEVTIEFSNYQPGGLVNSHTYQNGEYTKAIKISN